MSERATHVIRRELRVGDEEAVREIVTGTGFFSESEIRIAVELVQERRQKGIASGYHFVFLDEPSDESSEDSARTVGYSCFGPIDGTAASFDLYWIAVAESERGRGLGRMLLSETEKDIAAKAGQRIYVETSSRAQYVPTRVFYERTGYRQEATLEDFYGTGDSKVIFSKVLLQVLPQVLQPGAAAPSGRGA